MQSPTQTSSDGSMIDAVLREIEAGLRSLLADARPIAIDLRGMPLSPSDRDALERRLGRGEVEIRLRVVGSSEIWETSYRGVWWVRHRGGDDQVVSETIEITRVPAVVEAALDDMRYSAARLGEELGGGSG